MTTNTGNIQKLQNAAVNYTELRKKVQSAIFGIDAEELITPVNLREVKETWINQAKKGFFNIPVFKYDKNKLEITSFKYKNLVSLEDEVLEAYTSTRDVFQRLVLNYLLEPLQDAIHTTLLADSILCEKGDRHVSSYLQVIYGLPSNKSLEKADFIASILRQNPYGEHVCVPLYQGDKYRKLRDVILPATAVKQVFEWALSKYNAKNTTVKITDEKESPKITFQTFTDSALPFVFRIPSNLKLNGFQIVGLIGDYVECKWRSLQNLKVIGALKCPHDLVFQGLASVKDIAYVKHVTGRQQFPDPYYILTEAQALSGKSFAESAAYLEDMLPKTKDKTEKIWEYTYSTYRGSSTNEYPYACCKDRTDFEGHLYVSEFKSLNDDLHLGLSALSPKLFEKTVPRISLSDMKDFFISDKNLQHETLEYILYCFRVGNF